MNGSPRHALTVDVEDWYQVSAFEHVVSRDRWDQYESRVVPNTERLLDLFARRGVRATFFTLGWVAERHPTLIARLVEAGHEVASHGSVHRLVHGLTPETFREDLARARRALEAAAPIRIRSFRAPSFSLTRESTWAYDVLRDEGYTVSSSVFPVRHDRYGIPDFPRGPVRVEDEKGAWIWELPMTTWRVAGRNVPASGGGWLRLLPLGVMRAGLRQAEADGRPGMLYLHPWEVDPDQPRLREASRRARFRHTVNLARTAGRIDRLLDEFSFGAVADVVAGLEAGRFAGPVERRVLTGRAAAAPTASR